jgi:hypothetical protein
MGPRTGLDKRRMPFTCQESKPGPPDRYLVVILTEHLVLAGILRKCFMVVTFPNTRTFVTMCALSENLDCEHTSALQFGD